MIKKPFPWVGSKKTMARFLMDRMPEHTCYVEVFAGSAAVFFAREEPARVEVLNDFDDDIANFFRVLKHHLVEFCSQFRWAVTSRKMFEWANDTPPETLTDIQRAARFFYRQRLCFGGKPTKQTFGTSATAPPKLNLIRLEEELSDLHMRLADTTIECLPWRDCMRRYDRETTLFLLDPPYWQTTGYRPPAFTLADYCELAETMAALRGKAILTINDHPDMRAIFGAFPLEEVQVRETLPKDGKGSRGELVAYSWTKEAPRN